MNLREQIRRVLNTEETKKLVTKIRRRIPDLDDVVRRTTDWAMVHYDYVLNEVSEEWFVDTVMYNLYIDTISPIFEEWDEHHDDPFINISDRGRDNLLDFLTQHYFDVISERFNKRYKDDSPNEEIQEAELTEKCWKGYTQKGMKTMFGKRYPNCVKKTK